MMFWSRRKLYSKEVGTAAKLARSVLDFKKKSLGFRNRVGIGLSCQATRPTRRNYFLGIDSWAPSKFKNPGSEVLWLEQRS